ncbi:MAG: ATP-binding protein [Methylococcaceae bacterium]
MTFQLESQYMVISKAAEVIAIRRIAKEMARDIGFNATHCEEISLVVSELASNITKHAERGMVTITPLLNDNCRGLMIEAEDDGEGFNEHTMMKDGVSTSETLGVGLGAINRLMDEFEILQRADHTGTHIVCKRWLYDNSNHGQICPFEFGVISRPKPGETANGDTFIIKHIRAATLVGVIDGVGHGELARQAANAARQYVERHADSPLLDIFRGVDRACSVTRGVVMALAVFDWTQGSFRFASVGNIEVKVFNHDREKLKFVTRRGVVGKFAPPPVVTENQWQAGDKMALYSDGISSHWNWHEFTNDAMSTAPVIAKQIYNTTQKDHDDATILIATWQ